MFISNLRLHSNFSVGKVSIPEIVDCYGKKGYGAIAITDLYCDRHMIFGRAISATKLELYFEILKSEKQRAWNDYRMVLISGLEIVSSKTLLLGLETHPYGSHVIPTKAAKYLYTDLFFNCMKEENSIIHALKNNAFEIVNEKESLRDHWNSLHRNYYLGNFNEYDDIRDLDFIETY